MEYIIIAIATMLILPLVFSSFYAGARREEAKIVGEFDFKITGSKGLRLFFLIWAIVCFLGMTALFIYNLFVPFWEALVISEIFILAFGGLGLFGYIYLKGNYVVVKEEHLIIKKLFKQSFIVKYEDIAYSNCFGASKKIIGGYEFLDKDGVRLFSCEFASVGINKLANILRNHYVQPIPFDFPTKEMKNNPRFMEQQKKGSYKLKTWCYFGFGITFAVIAGMIFPQISLKEFENTPVTGIVESVTFTNDFVEFKLENDDSEYVINSIIDDELQKQTQNLLAKGASIKLTIGYMDALSRKNISSLEIEGFVCLTIDDAYNAEYDNYFSGLIGGIVILSIATLLIILFIINLIKLKRYKSKLNINEQEKC